MANGIIKRNFKNEGPESPLTEDVLSYGLRLAEADVDVGGWKQYFRDTTDIAEICKRPLATMTEQEMISTTAILLNNEKRHLDSMDEATRAITVGGFQDVVLGMIRAGIPQHPVMDWVGVQPLNRKHGQIYYMNYVIGQTKGQYTAGRRVFDALGGYTGGHNYTNEFIDRELMGAGDALDTTPLGGEYTLRYAGNGATGIRPGSVRIQWFEASGVDTGEARDDGNGVFITTLGSALTATINYRTGVISTLSWAAAPGTASIYVSYEADLEGSSNLPQIDVQLTVSPITAQRRALRYGYSAEAEQEFSAEFGRSIATELADGATSYIITEQAREVLADLWDAAGAPFQTFNMYNVPGTSGITNNEHFGDIKWPLNKVINQMYQETQRVHANVMIVDTAMATLLQSLGAPYFFQFDRAVVDNATLGVKFIGIFDGRIRVYMDSLLNTLPNASQWGNALLLYKGSGEIRDVSYVWAPYRAFYMSPAYTLDDLVSRRAMASRVGRKLVNQRLVKRFAITNVA